MGTAVSAATVAGVMIIMNDTYGFVGENALVAPQANAMAAVIQPLMMGGVTPWLLSVSGGVKFPTDGYDILSESLEQYVSKALLKIFYNKTQYDKYMQENQIPESEIEIIPLAFTRELLRGGLPQFFFAIETPPVCASPPPALGS